MPKSDKIKGGKGSADDQLTILGVTTTSVKSGKGNDRIEDRGGAEDKVSSGAGDDVIAFYYSGNEAGLNDYDGDKDSDTLELHFTRAQWMQLNPLIQTDLDAFIAHLATATKKAYAFAAIGVEASEFEQIRLFVDDVELSPQDDSVTVVDDAASLTENNEISGSVLINDTVPDLVRQVELVSAPITRGALTLNSDGSYAFATGNDFEELALEEPATVSFTYRVTDATGDHNSATMELTIIGQNDAPEMLDTTTQIVEDGPVVEVDLSLLGSDIDSDDQGDTLIYSITTPAAVGQASIDNTNLLIAGGSDFQYLAVGETEDIAIGITATDKHGATASSTVSVTVSGSNDLPQLSPDVADVIEDGAVTIAVLANDSDVDASDILRITEAAGAAHGSVQLVDGDDADTLANDLLLYTPDADFSGTDSFSYTVDDGNGGVVSQTATVNVAARADAPVVSHEIIAGATATQFTLRVTANQTDLDGSEVIDRIELFGTTAEGNAVDLSPYVASTQWTPVTASGSATADFQFNLPAGSASDFEVTARAIAKEPSNGDEAHSETGFTLAASGASASSQYAFHATDQSIWSNGNAFNYNGAFNANGELTESADFGASVIGPIDIRVAGTGATTHFSTQFRTDIDIDLGTQSRFGVNGGEVDAILNYSTDVTSTLNKTTDVLSIQTQAHNYLPANGFSASTPNIYFEQALTDFALDMGFGLYFWGYLHLHYTAGTQHVVNMPNIWDGLSIGSPDVGIDLGSAFGSDGLSLVRYDGNALHLLEGLYTQTEYSGTKEDGLRNELFSWTLNSHDFTNYSESVNWGGNQVTGTEARNFASIRFDLDGIVAHMRNQPNPVHQELDTVPIGPLTVGANAELLDIDLVLSAGYRQDNFLQPGQLKGIVVFEDDSRISFNFGDEINVSNASARDANGDGRIDYLFEMNPDAQFQTNAFIDLSLRDEVDILTASVNGGVEGFGGIGLSQGPIKEFNGTVIDQTVPIQLVGNSFALNVGTAESELWMLG